MFRFRRRGLAIVLGVVVVAVVGVGVLALSSGDSDTSATEGGRAAVDDGATLTMRIFMDPETLDPALVASKASYEALVPICESLYRIDDQNKAQPQLATELPKFSADNRTITIPLRTDAVFNDGTPFNAKAVKLSLERAAENSFQFQQIKIESIETPDAQTVVLKLEEPYAPLVSDLGGGPGMIVSPTHLKKVGDKFGTDPVCVGPFRFVNRQAGSSVTYERAPDYYDRDAVRLGRLVIRTIPETNPVTLGLRSGSIDVATDIAAETANQIEDDPELKLISRTSLGWSGLVVNIANSGGPDKPRKQRDTPFARSKEVRQAFSAALDRGQLAELVGGTPSCSPISSESSSFDNPDCQVEADVERAKELLAEAGVTTPVKVDLLIVNDTPTRRYASAIQSMVAEAGFDVSISTQDLDNRVLTGDYDVWATGFVNGLPDPDPGVSSYLATGAGINFNGYSDPEVDRLLAEARAELDPKRRGATYKKALDMVRDSASTIFVYTPTARSAVTKRLNDYYVTPFAVANVGTAGLAAD